MTTTTPRMVTSVSFGYSTALDSVVEDTVAPHAAEVDRDGTFPRPAIDAIAKAGLLGLISSPEVGGHGLGMREAAQVVERLAAACGSTAMVVLMHYAATAVLEAYGPPDVRGAIAGGGHLSTLAFSESGSRSHFWAPVSTATVSDGDVSLDARKSWVTASGEADSYVWSSRPLEAPGPMTLWLVPADTAGLSVQGAFDGFGLRGNASSPVTGEDVRIPRDAMLGTDGTGLDIALQTALPFFLVLNAAFSVGTMEALVAKAADHLTGTTLEHLGETLAEQPMHRGRFAALRTLTDQTRAFLEDTLAALESGREDATLRVLQVKAVAAENASTLADGVMRLCGGSAFRKEMGVERLFRDALAARVMAPTTEALHEFVGRAALGMPLM
jgi:isovaleryl-CoA dehydrogenase